MVNYTLIIDDQVADISDKEMQIDISYSISEAANIEERTNPTTKTITLPGTKRNCKIFGYPEIIDVQSYKGQKKLLNGALYVNGTEIQIGVVNLKNVIREGDKIEFEITIIGSSGEWITTMKDADLMGLDIGGEHEKTESIVTDSLVGDQVYLYPLVNHGFTGGQVLIGSVEDDGNGKAKFIIDGTNTVYGLRTNIAVGDKIYGTSFSLASYNKTHTIVSVNTFSVLTETMFVGDSSGKIRTKDKSDVRVEDRPIALSVYAIFSKLFTDAGFKISSVFTESDFFKNLFILPGHESQGEEFSDDHSGSVGLSAEYHNASLPSLFPIPFDTIISDPGSHFTTVTRFTADRAMLVNFKVVLRVKTTGSGDLNAQIHFLINGSITYHTNKVMEWQGIDEDYQTIEQEAELRLQSGDYVEVGLNTDDFEGREIYISSDETLFEATVSDKIIKGSSVVPGDQLPDIKQLDFVKAIRHLFNLYFFTDVNMKKVYIEPRDDFFSETVLDWSEKLDVSKQVTIEELGADVNKKLILGYKKDSSDWSVEEWEKNAKRDYSIYTAILDNRFSQGEKKILNELFSPTLMGTFDCVGLKTSKVPKIWQEPEDDDGIPERIFEYEPRILYYAGLTALGAGESWTFEGTENVTNYPLLASWYCSQNNNSLMFDDRSRDREMFIRYYANYVRTLNESRKVTANFKLNPSDIQAFISPDDSVTVIKDYRAKIAFIYRGVNVHARIDSIKDYTVGETTKVILITDSDNTFVDQRKEILTVAFINNLTSGNFTNGGVANWGDVWATIRSGTTGRKVYNDNAKYGCGARFDGVYDYFYIERYFLYFDTSSIPDTATITDAYMEIYKIAGHSNQELSVYEGTQANLLTKEDFDSFGTTLLGESTGGILGYRKILLNSDGLALISKIGYTKFCLRNKAFDAANLAPDGNYETFKTYLNSPITGYQNRLVVNYYV
jgi:hypothetical protein